MTDRPACWTDGEVTLRAPGFTDDGRSCRAWTTMRSVEAIYRISNCRGCSRLILAQITGHAPGRLGVIDLLPPGANPRELIRLSEV